MVSHGTESMVEYLSNLTKAFQISIINHNKIIIHIILCSGRLNAITASSFNGVAAWLRRLLVYVARRSARIG